MVQSELLKGPSPLLGLTLHTAGSSYWKNHFIKSCDILKKSPAYFIIYTGKIEIGISNFFLFSNALELGLVSPFHFTAVFQVSAMND